MSLVRGHVQSAGRSTTGVLLLDDATRNSKVRVLRISGGTRLIHRLAALGIVPGAILTVLKSGAPTIVSLGGARIAVGHSASTAVRVEVVQA
jgi:Fe2+ transport system protein FeoA